MPIGARHVHVVACLCAILGPVTRVRAQPGAKVVRLGAGSYRIGLPRGVKGPPPTIYRTEQCQGPMPTNDWWSSVAWLAFSERQ